MQTLVSVLALFAMIGLGFGAAKARLIDEAAIGGLVNFIYFFAIPPMLVAILAQADPAKLASGGGFLAAMLLVELVVASLAALWAWRTFGAQIGAAGFGIMGFSACFSNGVFLGLPLIITAAGPEAAPPALLLITLDICLFVFVTFLLAAGRRGGRAAATSAAIAVARNPIILATAIGLTLAFSGWPIPFPVQAFIDLAKPAAAPTALFALGATMALRRISLAVVKPAGVLVGLKLFVQPALAALALWLLPGVDPLWRVAGVIFMAGPIGMNAYLFARRYDIGVPVVSTAIVVSTALSTLTLTTLLIWFTTND